MSRISWNSSMTSAQRSLRSADSWAGSSNSFSSVASMSSLRELASKVKVNEPSIGSSEIRGVIWSPVKIDVAFCLARKTTVAMSS